MLKNCQARSGRPTGSQVDNPLFHTMISNYIKSLEEKEEKEQNKIKAANQDEVSIDGDGDSVKDQFSDADEETPDKEKFTAGAGFNGEPMDVREASSSAVKRDRSSGEDDEEPDDKKKSSENNVIVSHIEVLCEHINSDNELDPKSSTSMEAVD